VARRRGEGRRLLGEARDEAIDLRVGNGAEGLHETLPRPVLGEADEVEEGDAEPIRDGLEGGDGGAGQAPLEIREVALGAELALVGELLQREAGLLAKVADALADAEREGIGSLPAGHAL